MKTVSLHIAATPWNFLNSFAFAANRPEETSYLMYVDFPEDEPNIYLQALDKMEKSSPFVKAWCFHGKYQGAWKKWRNRLREIQYIKEIVAELKPDQVFVGSDRRIEFQCAMTEAVKHKPNVKGIYLDEGLFSYTCRKRSQTWRDRVLDSWIKRLMYPVDWKHPSTIGASDWISEGWLLKPENACSILKKTISLKTLSTDLYHNPRTDGLMASLGKNLQVFENGFEALILLPHPSALSEQVKRAFTDQFQAFDRLLVKAHPRGDLDSGWLPSSAKFLPADVPLELILAHIHVKKIISSQTTALLTSKLICPEIIIKVVDPVSPQFKALLDKL